MKTAATELKRKRAERENTAGDKEWDGKHKDGRRRGSGTVEQVERAGFSVFLWRLREGGGQFGPRPPASELFMSAGAS